MTPPPTMTTWARDGRSTTGGHLLEEPREVGSAEGRDRLLVALRPPPVEVVVDRAGRGLDEAPERPAVLARQHLQPHPREGGSRERPEVRLGVRLDLLGREVALGRGVPELEARVVVAGVLV